MIKGNDYRIGLGTSRFVLERFLGEIFPCWTYYDFDQYDVWLKRVEGKRVIELPDWLPEYGFECYCTEREIRPCGIESLDIVPVCYALIEVDGRRFELSVDSVWIDGKQVLPHQGECYHE